MKNYLHDHMECKVTIYRNYVKCKAVLCYKTLKGNQTHGYMYIYETRPSVNYAKDWLDHSFLFPGLVWSEKEFYFGYDH